MQKTNLTTTEVAETLVQLRMSFMRIVDLCKRISVEAPDGLWENITTSVDEPISSIGNAIDRLEDLLLDGDY